MPDPILKGSLQDNSFAKIYYAIAGQGKTGVLDLLDTNNQMVRKRVYFLGGDSSFVMFGPVQETLGQLLVDQGMVTEDQLEEAIDEVAIKQQQLGKVLIDKGWMTNEKLHDILIQQVHIKTVSCFAYTDGFFRFEEESIAKFDHDVPMYKIKPESVVYMGVERHYSLDRLEHEFEHLKEKGIRRAEGTEERVGRMALMPDELAFLKAVGRGRPFSKMLGKSDLGLTRTLKLLYILLVTGVLEVAEIDSISSHKYEEKQGIRRKPKTIELEDPDDSGDGFFKKDGEQSAGASEVDKGFADMVSDYLSDKMGGDGEAPAGKGDLVEYKESAAEIEVSPLSDILLENKGLALEAYTGKAGDASTRLGEMLIQAKVIDAPQMQSALKTMREKRTSFLNALLEIDAIEDEHLHDFLSDHYKVPAVKLSELELDQDIVSLIPEDMSKKHRVIPINKTGRTLVVAMADPHNFAIVDEIKFLTEYNVDVVVATDVEISEAIDKYHDSSEMLDDVMANFDDSDIDVADMDDDFDIMSVESESESAPVVKLVNQVLVDALSKGASDIHFEPYENAFRVRYRIDGVLYHILSPPYKLRNSLVSRIKIMSKLDIAERRMPQDGRVSMKMGKKKIDFRVSTLPTLWGEKMVLRILDKESLQLDLTKLGMEHKQLDDLRWALHQPYGMVLVTGPSGSGKTTTLYSALIELNKISENISTAEDPIEYYLEGINQVQMLDEIGLNFAYTLRSFLRQDPDIIMVGEIRDFETAEIAVKAALTGHVVLTTVHTNDAPSTVNRLLNMGVEPFLITAAVTGVMSQRLVRKLCDACKEPEELEEAALIQVGVPKEQLDSFQSYQAVGCPACAERGFKGRLGLYEVMVVKGELGEYILNGATPAELKKEAMGLGMRTMRQAGLSKVNNGETTISEITRTTMPDYFTGFGD